MPGGKTLPCSPLVTNTSRGAILALALCAASRERRATGVGQLATESCVLVLEVAVAEYAAEEIADGRRDAVGRGLNGREGVTRRLSERLQHSRPAASDVDGDD